ncbi:hypothetical protein ACSNOI_03965 [Actinomadura kijaniata]|uniref:hypothetical protein n=1 Tax=Actinomadura kijaniata TaxID=46161 RepID=UPI003F19F510
MGNALRPVVDPALPPEERALLRKSATGLAPASAPAPTGSSWGGRVRGDMPEAVTVATLCGFLPAVAGFYLRGLPGLAAGAVAQTALAVVLWSGGFKQFVLAGTVLQIAAWVVLMVLHGGKDQRAVLGRVHHGRYYLEADFDQGDLRPWFGAVPGGLMRRAQSAVTVVLESDVESAGLLDGTANAVVLPRLEWEIARSLAELTRNARELDAAAQPGRRGRKETEPQRKASRDATAEVLGRVRALEEYAARVRAADKAYREWRTARELEELGAETRESLARAVRDELVAAEVGDLAERPGLAPLRDSLQKAREAGRTLAEPAVEQV